jgi:ferredoxin
MIIKEMLAANKQKCMERAEKLPELSAAQNLAEGTCPVIWCLEMVKAARAEACGKSVMCRDGLWQLQLMLEGIANGQSNSDDLDVMKELLETMQAIGCPNTQKVAGLVLASLSANGEEWDLHVRRRRCTALKCFYSLYIDPATCNGCGECLKAAPSGAVAGGEGMIHVITDENQVKNEAFIASCPVGAIKKCGAIKPPVPPAPVAVGTFGAGAGAAAGGGRRRRRG